MPIGWGGPGSGGTDACTDIGDCRPMRMDVDDRHTATVALRRRNPLATVPLAPTRRRAARVNKATPARRRAARVNKARRAPARRRAARVTGGAPIWGRAARVKARGAPAGHRASQPTSRDDYQSQGRQGGSQCHRRARRWLAKTILAYYRGPENESG
jgi:hypothetical protein